MMLTGPQLSRIHQAILPAYTYDELRRVVMAGMNVDIDHLVSPKKAYSDQIFEVLPDLVWLQRTRLQRMQTGTDSTPRKETPIRCCPNRL